MTIGKSRSEKAMRDIARDQWVSFLDRFNRQHDRWLVTVEVSSPHAGQQIESFEQPLIGVTAELAQSKDDAISILVGGRTESHLARTVLAPSRMQLEETEQGAHESLSITAGDGTTTVLRFRRPIVPELVDGFMPDR
jgi:hypothetical protein